MLYIANAKMVVTIASTWWDPEITLGKALFPSSTRRSQTVDTRMDVLQP